MSAPLALKCPRGFFAAGREIEQALELLSDSAFKLFVYACLYAERRSGRFRFRIADVARRLGKSSHSITSDLEELQRQGVCRLQAAPNHREPVSIEIADRFWPYLKQPAEPAANALMRYVDQVRKLFLSRPSVAGTFTAADERLAADWARRRVPLERVERAYLLGCARKTVALLNDPAAALISSLRYFAALLAEVSELKVSADYWRHLARQTDQLEQRWLRHKACSQLVPNSTFVRSKTRKERRDDDDLADEQRIDALS